MKYRFLLFLLLTIMLAINASQSFAFDRETKMDLIDESIELCPVSLKNYLNRQKSIIYDGVSTTEILYEGRRERYEFDQEIKSLFYSLIDELSNGRENNYNTIRRFGVIANLITEKYYFLKSDLYPPDSPYLHDQVVIAIKSHWRRAWESAGSPPLLSKTERGTQSVYSHDVYQTGKGVFRGINLYGGAWYGLGDGSWQVSFPYDGIANKSRLEWEEIDGPLYMAGVKIKPYSHALTLDLQYGDGEIEGGRGTDSDLYGDLVLESKADTEGDSKYYSADLYLLVYPDLGETIGWGKSERLYTDDLKVELFFGWFYYEDSLLLTDGVVTEDPFGVAGFTGPFPGLESQYEFRWDGFRVGFQAERELADNPWDSHGIKFKFAYFFMVDYEGEGIWNLRADFRQDPSFRHEGDNGFGFECLLGLYWEPVRHIRFNLDYRYFLIRVEHGTDTTFFSDGTRGRCDLDKVESTRHGPSLMVNFYF